MKTLIITGMCYCLPSIVSAQHFTLWIANRKLTSAQSMEFDLMIRTVDSAAVIPLKFVQAGYRFNPEFINGGKLTGSYVPGSSELEASFGKTWGFSYNASQFVLNQSANVGSYCPGALIGSRPRRIARFRLVNTVAWGCADDSISFVTSGSSTLKLAVVKYNSTDCSDAYPSFITSLCHPYTQYPNPTSLQAASSVLPLDRSCDSVLLIMITATGGAEPYYGTGSFYAGPGTHTFIVNDARGCLDTVTAVADRLPVSTSFYDSACEKYILPWGNTVIQSGIYSHTFSTAAGCDSLVTAYISILQPDTSNETINIDPGQLPYAWNGIICATPGTFTAVLFNQSGCDSIVTLTLSLTDTCSPKEIVSTAVNDSICPEGSATLTVTGNFSLGAQWLWYAGGCGTGSLIGRGQSIRVSPRSTATYFVRSQGGACGTTACASRKVYVKNKPAVPGPVTGINSGLCQAADISFTVEPDSLVSRYQWYVPDGAVIQSGQGSSSVKVNFSNSLVSNTYTSYNNICVKTSNSCGTSACRNYYISLKPAAAGTIAGPVSLIAGQSAEYTSSVFGADGYLWSVGSGWRILAGQGTNRISVRAGSSNGYVKLIPSNACGQGSSGTSFITVSSAIARNQTVPSVTVYPNPASSVLHLHAKGGLPDHIDIADMQGRVIRQCAWSEEISMAGMSSGVYFIRIYMNDSIYAQKFTVIR